MAIFWIEEHIIDRYVLRAIRRTGLSYDKHILQETWVELFVDRILTRPHQKPPDLDVIYGSLQRLSAKGCIEKYVLPGADHPIRYRVRLYQPSEHICVEPEV